jgi:hypothetical protein
MKKVTMFLTGLALVAGFNTTPSYGATSAQHTSQASKHSALAVKEGVVSTAKVASVAVAVPLVVAGGTSLALGTASMDAASGNKKVTVTKTTVVVDKAPNQAMKKKDDCNEQ